MGIQFKNINLGFLLITILSVIISVGLLFRQSIRLDEAQSIWMFSKSIPTMLEITSQDVNLPFYGVVLHFWLQLFGTKIIFARLLSLIIYILTLPVLYALAKESSNNRQALITVALFAFSPFIVWYTSEARTYTLFTLITSLNHLYFLRFLRSRGAKGKLGFFISVLLGLYTHYFFLFLLATQFFYIAVQYIWHKEQRDLFIFMYLGLVATALLLFTPWLTYVIQQGSASNTQPVIPKPTSYNLIQSLVNFIFGFQNQKIQNVLVSLWPLSIILLFFAFTRSNKIKSRNFDYYLAATFFPIAMVFLVSFYKPIFLSRYLILVTPSLFFIIAWMLLNHPKRISFYLTTTSLVLMFGLLVYQNISATTPVKEDYAGVTSYLDQNVNARDIIAISAPFTVYPIEYQYKGGAKLVTIPDWNRYSHGAIPVYSKEQMIAQIGGYKGLYNRLFLVLSYDQGYQNDITQYLDTHYKRLDMRNFSETIELRVYQTRY